MVARRQNRPDPRALTAATGEGGFGEEPALASDRGLPSSAETMGPEIVGRTPYDLLHEHGIAHAVAKVLRSIDAVELLGTLSYILLGLFGKSGLPMRMWVFLALLAGYHIVGKPVGSFFEMSVERRLRRNPNARNGE
jgi:hypothetical protein